MIEPDLTDLHISFNPFEIDLLGVMDGDVYIKETLFEKDSYEKSFVAVVCIPTTRFKQLCSEYLEDKRRYCENRKYFCGHGYVGIEEYEHIGSINILTDFTEDDEPIYSDVPLFKALECFVDMEHG